MFDEGFMGSAIWFIAGLALGFFVLPIAIGYLVAFLPIGGALVVYGINIAVAVGLFFVKKPLGLGLGAFVVYNLLTGLLGGIF